jgi:hypothetical protein
MADRDRFRKDDFDDDELNPPPSNTDNTGTIIATIFGVWAAVVGAFGLIWVIVFLCFVAFFFIVFCLIASIFFTIFSAAARMQPPPQPQQPPGINQPNNPPGEKPKPRLINPGWKDNDFKATWLSDMDEFDAKVGWGQFGKKGKLGYSTKAGEVNSPIMFNGQPNPQGISMAPAGNDPSSVKYRLGHTYKLFKASVACNDLDPGENGPHQPMTFKVYGDGELLWVSEPVSKVGVKQDVRLGVFGVDVLELRVQCGDGNSARAIWLDPQVLK